jgi:AcrR family transcriptional regulator
MQEKPKRKGSRYHHGDLRAALLKAGIDELAAKGYEGFTLRGVAKRAAVSHAAPAHHFRDTNALLTALTALAAERFSAAMRERQAKASKEPRAQLIAAGHGYIDFALANPALFKLMFGSERSDSDDPDVVRHATDAFVLLVGSVAAVRESDPLASDSGRLDVAAAWSIVHGIANLLIAGRLRFLEPQLEKDRDGTLAQLIDRTLP